ncbi:penicillin-binding protein 2, partial [bacterium]|nr:penicillin-binding protein 2 [bacterium]
MAIRTHSPRQVFGQSHTRVYVMAVILCLPVLIILARLVQVQVIYTKDYQAKAYAQQSRKFEIPATRGGIYVKDNDGLYPVALNDRQKFLYVDPKLISDPEEVAAKLSPITGLDQSQLTEQLTYKESRYIELKQRVSKEEAEKILELELAGVILQDRDYRYYTEGSLFSHVLGYVNSDGKGQYGVEDYLNSRLSGKSGQLRAITDHRGIPIATQENILTPAQNGEGVVLTLDRYIQGVAEVALKRAIAANRAPSGSVIVMDPYSGAIKALVNYPDFDPNNYNKVTDYSQFINSAITNQFEPGSGFKTIVMALGIETGKIRPETSFNDTGSTTIGEYTIYNAEKKSYGTVDMGLVIKNSINTGMVFILRMMGGDSSRITKAGKELFYDGIQKFGFGKRTGIELAGEATGRVKDTRAADIDYANMAFGQGISATSMQMISAVATIANGGTLVTPYVAEKTIDDESKLSDIPHQPRAERVISKQTADDVAQMMVKVVEGGSGYLTRMPGYKIA